MDSIALILPACDSEGDLCRRLGYRRRVPSLDQKSSQFSE